MSLNCRTTSTLCFRLQLTLSMDFKARVHAALPALYLSLHVVDPESQLWSLGIIVTCFACMAHKLLCFNKFTIYISAASCKASIALLLNLRSTLKSCVILQINLLKHSFLHNSSVDFWYLHISIKAFVPGQ